MDGEDPVVFEGDDDVADVLNKPSVGNSKFLAWMECNKSNSEARTLTTRSSLQSLFGTLKTVNGLLELVLLLLVEYIMFLLRLAKHIF